MIDEQWNSKSQPLEMDELRRLLASRGLFVCPTNAQIKRNVSLSGNCGPLLHAP
jgi:hypothetical protein